MMYFFVGVLRRDLLLFSRRAFVWITPFAFFLLVVLVFSIAASPTAEVLRNVAPGVLWVAVLLGGLLAQESMFRADNENGFIEQALVSPQPLPLFVLAKATAHWLLTAAPLLLLLPLAAEMLRLPAAALPAMLLSLPFGTAALSLLAAFAAALTLEHKTALLPILLADCRAAVFFGGAHGACADAVTAGHGGRVARFGRAALNVGIVAAAGVAAEFLSRRRPLATVAGRGLGVDVCRRTRLGIKIRPRRLSAGGRLSHYFCARSGGVAVVVYLYFDDCRRRHRLDLEV